MEGYERKAHFVIAGLLVTQRRHRCGGCGFGAIAQCKVELYELLCAAALVGRAEAAQDHARQPAALITWRL